MFEEKKQHWMLCSYQLLSAGSKLPNYKFSQVKFSEQKIAKFGLPFYSTSGRSLKLCLGQCCGQSSPHKAVVYLSYGS